MSEKELKESPDMKNGPEEQEIPVDDSNNGGLFRINSGPKGRGLFATANIAPHTLIHVAPCIPVSRTEYEQFLRHTVFEHYLFNDKSTGNKLLALGYGSLFNHSSRQPNVDYRVDSENLLIRYISGHRPITADEELCIYYGANLWFDDTDEGGDAKGQVGNHAESNSSNDSDALDEEGLPFFLGRMELGEEEDDACIESE